MGAEESGGRCVRRSAGRGRLTASSRMSRGGSCSRGAVADVREYLMDIRATLVPKPQTLCVRRSRCPRIPELARAFSHRPLPIADRQVMITR